MSIVAATKRAKSKTYWLGFAIMILGYAQQNMAFINEVVGEHQGVVNFGIGLSVLVLREITKKPISDK